jgi:hypothetical protein
MIKSLNFDYWDLLTVMMFCWSKELKRLENKRA